MAAGPPSCAMDLNQPSTITDLPESLLARIPGHLTPVEACRGVAQANRAIRKMMLVLRVSNISSSYPAHP